MGARFMVSVQVTMKRVSYAIYTFLLVSHEVLEVKKLAIKVI